MPDNPTSRIESYRDLWVWQKAMELTVASYGLARRLPAREMYGLASQIQRAAVSIPANIAEGNGRKQLGEYIQHLSIANGSLKELETHFLLAVRLKYLQESEIAAAIRLSEDVGRLLIRLIHALRAKR